MKRILEDVPCLSIRQLLFAAVLLPFTTGAAAAAQQPNLGIAYALRDKNFHALNLFDTDRAVHDVLSKDKFMQAMERERLEALRLALAACKGDAACELTPLLWSNDQIMKISAALKSEYEINPAIRKAADSLRRSMAYQLFAKKDGPALLADAWTLCAHGLNEVISVYGLGTKPLYPQIDSMSLDISTGTYQQLVHSAIITSLTVQPEHPSVFFSASLNTAIGLLMLNHRDEAARFEPVEETLNRSAVHAAMSVDWANYEYSAIVVPGQGPEDLTTPLSTLGRKRVALAAEAFHQGIAPFVLVSGGFVHPSQTRFAEASEMKLALLREFAVPESAILVEPFARHTTTNLRNAVRELYWYGIPLSKPILVVSDPEQISYIASPQMKMRCQKELGYLPVIDQQQVSETRLAVLPDINSLQRNPIDPLDP